MSSPTADGDFNTLKTVPTLMGAIAQLFYLVGPNLLRVLTADHFQSVEPCDATVTPKTYACTFGLIQPFHDADKKIIGWHRNHSIQRKNIATIPTPD